MTIYIDDKPIEANPKESILQIANNNGFNIPFFCWHPELSIVGSCRMCLVEVGSPKRNQDGSLCYDENKQIIINYFPKLQIACNTFPSDEMRINTSTPPVIKARQAVMEFLLINHPLDCPICDEAGACKLQDYSTTYSKGRSRFTEEKNSNLKRSP